MRNTIKYNRYKGSKFLVKRVNTLVMTGVFVLISGMLVGTPLVASDGEVEIISEPNVTVKPNETIKVGSAGASKAIQDTLSEEELAEIEKEHVALSNGAEEKEVILNDFELEKQKREKEEKARKEAEQKKLEEEKAKQPNVIKIRCTGYDDKGITKSGEPVHEGVIAGKDEWLHKKCKLYKINEDGSVGELIGEYTFLDTGYGIKTETPDGIKGSLKIGKSIDVWHPSEAAIWEWMDKYGDYVYMEGPY